MSELATIPENKAVRANPAADERGLQIRSMDEMARFCQGVHNSGEFKHFKSPESVMVAVQFGLEIGLSPMQALANIYVVNGRPSLFGDAAISVCCNHPAFEDCVETSEGEGEHVTAVCAVTRKGRTPVIRKFSISDAKRAGLWGKQGPWSQYPMRMLQMRARGFALRDAFPDALKGLSVVSREEIAYIPQEKPAEKVRLILPGKELPESLSGAVRDINPATGEFELEAGE